MLSLGRQRLKIQQASEDITEGGIAFPISKTSYIEENTKRGEEDRHFCSEFTLKRQGTVSLQFRHAHLRRATLVEFLHISKSSLFNIRISTRHKHLNGSSGPEVRQDISQDASSSKSRQLLLRREEYESQREAIYLMETWETRRFQMEGVLIVKLGFFQLFCYV